MAFPAQALQAHLFASRTWPLLYDQKLHAVTQTSEGLSTGIFYFFANSALALQFSTYHGYVRVILDDFPDLGELGLHVGAPHILDAVLTAGRDRHLHHHRVLSHTLLSVLLFSPRAVVTSESCKQRIEPWFYCVCACSLSHASKWFCCFVLAQFLHGVLQRQNHGFIVCLLFLDDLLLLLRRSVLFSPREVLVNI